MRFVTEPHRFYGGSDRHTRSLHLGVPDQAGNAVLDKHSAARRRTGVGFGFLLTFPFVS